jgi:hypothetical protein
LGSLAISAILAISDLCKSVSSVLSVVGFSFRQNKCPFSASLLWKGKQGGEIMLKFLVGIGCGVGLGLLIAPAPGEETRRQLLDLARNPREAVRRQVRDIREDIAQAGADLGRRVAEKAVDQVVPESLNQPDRRQA